MKLIKIINQDGRIDTAIVTLCRRYYNDASVFELNIFLWSVLFKFQIGLHNGKKKETL